MLVACKEGGCFDPLFHESSLSLPLFLGGGTRVALTLVCRRYLIAFKNLLRSIESLGIASVEGINYFGRGILLGDNYVNYVRHDALGRDLLSVAFTYVPSLKMFYEEITLTMPEYGKIKAR